MKNIFKTYILIFSLCLSNDKIGFIANAYGDVEILSKEKRVPILSAVAGRYIYKGDVVRTYKDSYCSVVFLDYSAMISMSEMSEVSIKAPKSKLKKIDLNYGSIYFENSSQLIPLFVFTGTTQVRSVSSSGYLVTLKNRDDHIYSIKNSVNIFNRYSKLKTIVQSNNKALSYTGGEIEIASSEEGFLPEKVMHSAKIIKEELKKPKTEFFLNDFDLIPNYSDSTSSVISIYSPPEKKFFTYKLGVFASTIKNNPYARIVFNPKYQNKYLTVDLILDEYIALDGSPSIKNWSKPENFLSKIKSLDYLYGANYINYRSGSIDNVTFGHGLVIKNYTNKYNYPLTNRFGVDFEFKNRNFISFKVFVSDLSQASDNGAILGAHASLFVSKYIPLKMGVGLVSDMNQNHAVGADLNKKPIESLSFDFTYDLLNRKGYDINLISEIAALVYSDSYYYLRYEVENLDNALKNKDGSWGTAFGVDLSYNDFANIKTLIHYNDPLFVPSYFNATYEFERCRTRPKKDSYSALPEINAMFSDYEVTSLSDDNLIAIPKDLYLSYSEQEMVYSSIGTSIDFSYNYYDMVKAYFYYNIFFEPDNPISSDSFSSINLEILIGDKVLKNISELKFYYLENMSREILSFSSDFNENMLFGFLVSTKLKNNFNLNFSFERCHYDYNFNGEPENVNNFQMGVGYNF